MGNKCSMGQGYFSTAESDMDAKWASLVVQPALPLNLPPKQKATVLLAGSTTCVFERDKYIFSHLHFLRQGTVAWVGGATFSQSPQYKVTPNALGNIDSSSFA